MRLLFDAFVTFHFWSFALSCMSQGDESGAPTAMGHIWRNAWLGRYQRVTNRFAEAIEQLLRSSNIQAVAAFFNFRCGAKSAFHSTRCLSLRIPKPPRRRASALFILQGFAHRLLDEIQVLVRSPSGHFHPALAHCDPDRPVLRL